MISDDLVRVYVPKCFPDEGSNVEINWKNKTWHSMLLDLCFGGSNVIATWSNTITHSSNCKRLV